MKKKKIFIISFSLISIIIIVLFFNLSKVDSDNISNVDIEKMLEPTIAEKVIAKANAICGKNEHIHIKDCFLICNNSEHEHTFECFSDVPVCGIEEHEHIALCYNEEELKIVDDNGNNAIIIPIDKEIINKRENSMLNMETNINHKAINTINNSISNIGVSDYSVFKNQLDSTGKGIYNEIVKDYNYLIDNNSSTISVMYTSGTSSNENFKIPLYSQTIPIESGSVTASSSESAQTLINNLVTQEVSEIDTSVCKAAYDALVAFNRDYPEVFWLSGSYSLNSSISSDGYSLSSNGTTYSYSNMNVSYTLYYYPTVYNYKSPSGTSFSSTYNTVDNLVSTIIDNANLSCTTDYEYIKYFHDYLTKNNVYNEYALTAGINTYGRIPWSAASALTVSNYSKVYDNYNPVCEGYSRALKWLCDKKGIICILVSGDAGGAHMWNYIQLNGKWYMLDVTWNDPTVSGITSLTSGYENYNYFLAGSSNANYISSNRTNNGSFISTQSAMFSYPTMTVNDYDPSSDPNNEPEAAVINKVSIKPAATNIVKGNSKTFTATVTGSGSIIQNVIWSIEGNNSISTSISSNGLLSVGNDETASTITVKAVSTMDDTKYGTAIVTVTEYIAPNTAYLGNNEGGSDKYWNNILKYKSNESLSKKNNILPQYTSLYNQNTDMVGWITIEGTKINYPVMQNVADDEYYLRRDFDKKISDEGTPFVDGRCSILSNRSTNVIIYGHYTNSDRMFRWLHNYSSKDFWKNHKTIKFDTIYEEAEYKVISVFYTNISDNIDEEFKYFDFVQANSKKEFTKFVDYIEKNSLYDTDTKLKYGDEFITLSTCAPYGYSGIEKNGRLVVVAVLKK